MQGECNPPVWFGVELSQWPSSSPSLQRHTGWEVLLRMDKILKVSGTVNRNLMHGTGSVTHLFEIFSLSSAEAEAWAVSPPMWDLMGREVDQMCQTETSLHLPQLTLTRLPLTSSQTGPSDLVGLLSRPGRVRRTKDSKSRQSVGLVANQLFRSPGWMLTGPSFPETGVWTTKPPRWDLILKKRLAGCVSFSSKKQRPRKPLFRYHQWTQTRLPRTVPQLELQTWQACWTQGCTLDVSQSAQASH